ncbi:hypothetical protein D3C86_1397560 [compost metagenome]
MKILHVLGARRLEIHQYWRLTAHPVQGGQIHFQSHASGNGSEVDNTVGGSTNGQQHTHGIFERGRGQDLVDGSTLASHVDDARAGFFSNAHAIRGNGWGCRATRHGHAQRFSDTGHCAGGAHDRAGPYARDQPAVNVGYFNAVYFAGAEFTPVASAVSARPYPLAPVTTREH